MIARIVYDRQHKSFVLPPKTPQPQLIEAAISTLHPFPHKPLITHIFPDSGASICIADPKHILDLGATLRDLTPTDKTITAVGGTPLKCYGWLPVQFSIGNLTTQQALFVCDNVSNIFLSREGCVDLKILPSTFPRPMISSSLPLAVKAVTSTTHPLPPPPQPEPRVIPTKPSQLPYPLTEANFPKLKQYLLDKFAMTAFNNDRSKTFPTMTGPTAHIHLKPDAKPYCRPAPIPVPHHWKSAVKTLLDDQVIQGILGKLPIGIPTTWCHPLVIVPKKTPGKFRFTVDLQRLNSQCLRELHRVETPFNLACQIPSLTKKNCPECSRRIPSCPT